MAKLKKIPGVETITRIVVKGYKSLVEEANLEVRPLTILAGPNSSGKSSAMQPLLLIKQTLNDHLDRGPLKISGPNVRFTEVAQFIPINGNKKHEMIIGAEFNNNNSIIGYFSYDENSKNIIIEKYSSKFPGFPDNTLREGRSNIDAIVDGEKVVLKGQCKRNKCLYDFTFENKDGTSSTFSNPLPFNFGATISHIIHVPGLRGTPQRNYDIVSISQDYPGTFDEYVASVIAHWQKEKSEELNILDKQLRALELTSKVSTERIDDTQLSIKVARKLRNAKSAKVEMVNISDVGFGVSQVLPVLAALLVAAPGQLVYLEQPEVHLHPKAQVKLAEIIAEASKRGVIVVVETHSELLLLGVQTLVAENKLSPDLVKLHWFNRGPRTGKTTVTPCDLDAQGAFGDWPEDFSDVDMNVHSRYLDAAEESLLK